jgi:molecular chaperone HscC
VSAGASVGIDLGTTYSLVSIMEAGGPRIVPNALGELLTPSAVSFDEDGHVLVGAAARARARTHPERTATSFKRDMGTDRTRALGGQTLRAEQLSAIVLTELKRDAERSLGRAIAEAVVTVPAYFGELQRRATRDACELAGIHVERIINEPTAAALAYGLHQRDRELRAVVLDLGGGTFDVTVLEIIEGVIEIQSSAGDTRLGGDDFVDAMVELCQARIAKERGARVAGGRASVRLWEACEVAKRRLSHEARTQLALVGAELSDGRTVDLELGFAREEVEAAWAPLLARLRAPIARALRDANQSGGDVDEVLCVGGATRMPCFKELVAKDFGRLPKEALPPDEAVALGAAIQAALKAGDAAVGDLVVTDVAPFTLGIAVGSRMGTHVVTGLFEPILERGTVLPASRVKTFRTMSDYQRQIVVEVYQGEHAIVADNLQIGSLEVDRIPEAKAGEQAIDVRFTYDLNGLLEVESTITATRRKTTLLIDRSKGRLASADLKKAQKAMQQLKFHPSESLPNRTALARGDGLYVELRGVEREILGSALVSFRLALDTQDTARIDAARGELLLLIDRLHR